MPDKMKLTVKGLSQAKKNFGILRRSATRRIEDAMETSADQIVATARSIVPQKTSRLLRTITQARTPAPRHVIRRVVGADTEYAEFLEDPNAGRRHRSRSGFIGEFTPFLFPAVRRNFKNIVANVKKAVKGAMRDARAK